MFCYLDLRKISYSRCYPLEGMKMMTYLENKESTWLLLFSKSLFFFLSGNWWKSTRSTPRSTTNGFGTSSSTTTAAATATTAATATAEPPPSSPVEQRGLYERRNEHQQHVLGGEGTSETVEGDQAEWGGERKWTGHEEEGKEKLEPNFKHYQRLRK